MKKTWTIIIAVALVAALAVGGTLAVLSSTANDTKLSNTFTTSTAGSKLAITLNEGQVSSTTGKFTDSGVTRVASNSYPIIPTAIMDKDPTVTVAANSAPCYVFMYVTNTSELNGKDFLTIGAISSSWLSTSTSGLYVYAGGPVATATTDTRLPALFNTIIISGYLTTADTAVDPTGELNVQAYAYQASGSVTYDEALDAAVDLFT